MNPQLHITGLLGPRRALPSQALAQYVCLPREDQPKEGTQRILKFLHMVAQPWGSFWGPPFNILNPTPMAFPSGPL